MHEIAFKIFENTDKFRSAAIHYQIHKYYTSAPEGTTAFREYWDEEKNRCLYGYTAIDGEYITGYHYFYLNYCQILLIDEKKKVKTRNFPRFYDYDKYFFDTVEECERLGKHLAVLKARRKGYEQPYTELVATPDGFRQMGNLKLGEYVLNPDGKPTKIIEIHEQGYSDVFELTLSDGRKVKCGNEHLWSVVDKQSRNIQKEITVRTRDMYQKGLYKTYNGYNHYRYYLNPISEVEYEEKILPIHPYVLGVLLGDGNITNGNIRISSIDNEVLDRFLLCLGEEYYLYRDESTPCEYNVNVHNRFNRKYRDIYENAQYGVNPLRREINNLSLNVSHLEKHIPNIYKFGSIEQRYELVRGLLDTDGSVNIDGGIEFSNTSLELIRDLAEVLRSLGIKCNYNRYEGRESSFIYRLYLHTNKPVFYLNRKLNRIVNNKHKKRFDQVAIVDIVKLDYKEMSRCITVDNSNHLYLTRDYIPTHNSFKVASMLCRNYFLIPDSKGFALASNSEYLVKDGILSKAWEIMDFVDEHTAWSKKRQKVDTKMHKRASLVIDKGDGVKTEIGYKSEIIGVSLGGDYNSARGKAGKLIVFEEGGAFPNLKAAWQVARPSVEQGSTVYGFMIVMGTGGTENADFEGLKDIFYEPDAYNCLPIKNCWEEGATRPCGFYVPYTANLDGDYEGQAFMDDQGNSIFAECKKFVLKERQNIIDNASDRSMIDRYVAEHSLTPTEASLNISTNIFPKEELIRHLASIRNSDKIKEFKQVGDLVFGEKGTVQWVPTNIPKDLTSYRIPPGNDKHGQVVIWEHPIQDAPWGLYIGVTDPYDHDKSTTDSLLSCFIYKRTTPGYGQGDIIVAEYSGRPDTAEEAYEIARLLAIYYHCNILYENQCKGMFPYFTNKHSDYLLADQPDIIKDIIKSSNVQRLKGTHMSKEIKIWAEGKTKEWLNFEISPGVKRLTTIYSEALIEELIAYNDEGNFDRVICMFLLVIYLEELYHVQIRKRNNEANNRVLFREPLFQISPFKF